MRTKLNHAERPDSKVCKEAYQEFSESIFCSAPTTYGHQTPKTYATFLSRLVDFIDELTSSKEVPFLLRIGKWGVLEYDCSALANRYFRCLATFIEVTNFLSDQYRYCEQIEVFVHVCRLLGVFDHPLLVAWDEKQDQQVNIPSDSREQLFNKICERIRIAWTVEGYKKRHAQRKSDAKKRFKRYSAYPLRLFPNCARLVVLRIDLSYRKEIAHQFTLEDLKADVEHLLNNQRGSKELAFMKGYIVKFEYGIDKGFHAHFLVFLDGSKRQGSSHVYLTQKLGEYWVNTITKGRGRYWNCNAEADNYERKGRRGIGLIHRSEEILISNLQHCVIAYLCKMDQFIEPKYKKARTKLIRKGEVPKEGKMRKEEKALNEITEF